MVLERKGPVSTATRNCQNHVQRLRSTSLATVLPGSQGQDPRTLRPERLKWLSIPFPAKSHRRKASERGRGCWMGSTDPAKNELKAKIAASSPFNRHSRESGNPASSFRHAESWTPAFAGVTSKGSRAFAHHISNLLLDGRKGQSLAGTDPSTFFTLDCEGQM